MDESSVLSSSPDHVPISANWARHNVSTLERSNHDTAPNHSANNRVTQAMGASENEQCVYLHMERGTSSMVHVRRENHLMFCPQSLLVIANNLILNPLRELPALNWYTTEWNQGLIKKRGHANSN